MSKLSTFIHDHASVFKVGTEVLGIAIAELPVPAALKDPLIGVLTEMNKTANNMGDNANVVAENLLADLSGGVSKTSSTNPTLEAGLQAVATLAARAATVLSNSGGAPANNVTVAGAAPLAATPVVVAAPAPVVVAAPAPAVVAAPAPAVVAAPAPAVVAAPVQPLAPATAVSLGLAVDPNSAHAGPVETAPVAVVEVAEPGLAVVTQTPLQLAEVQMQTAIASGDTVAIEAAAQALVAAAQPPSPQ